MAALVGMHNAGNAAECAHAALTRHVHTKLRLVSKRNSLQVSNDLAVSCGYDEVDDLVCLLFSELRLFPLGGGQYLDEELLSLPPRGRGSSETGLLMGKVMLLILLIVKEPILESRLGILSLRCGLLKQALLDPYCLTNLFLLRVLLIFLALGLLIFTALPAPLLCLLRVELNSPYMSVTASQGKVWLLFKDKEFEGTRPLEHEGRHCLKQKETVVAEACLFQLLEGLVAPMASLLVGRLGIPLLDVHESMILDFIRIFLSRMDIVSHIIFAKEVREGNPGAHWLSEEASSLFSSHIGWRVRFNLVN